LQPDPGPLVAAMSRALLKLEWQRVVIF